MVIIYYHFIYINYADILKDNYLWLIVFNSKYFATGPEIYTCQLDKSYYTRIIRKLHFILIAIPPVPETISEGLQAETKWRLILPDQTWPLHGSVLGIFGYDSALAFVLSACALPRFRPWKQPNLSILIMFSLLLGALAGSEILQSKPLAGYTSR